MFEAGQTATVPVNGRTVINVSLQPHALIGEELVSLDIGYSLLVVLYIN